MRFTAGRARTATVAVLAVLGLAWGSPAGAAAVQTGLPSPSGWPLAGAIEVVRGFAPPATPWGAGHRGVDLAASVGDPVLAAAGGTITHATGLAVRGVVVVSHGSLRTTYEPVAAAVAVGQRVRTGDPLGTLQRRSHCPQRACLHWGLKRGADYLDPMALGRRDDATVRLLPATEREVARRRAAARAEAARAAADAAAATLASHPAGMVGPIGGHGLLRPVAGPITSPYGRRFHPILRAWRLHDGTDFQAACGTPIRAAQAGRVQRRSSNAGYGNRLMLDHGMVAGRHLVTGYNHATRYLVGVGARVQRGEVIGYVGNTGFSTGCHLHLMVWANGAVTDPMRWL